MCGADLWKHVVKGVYFVMCKQKDYTDIKTFRVESDLDE